MDPKLFYWTAALLDLALVCLFGVFGLRHARRGEIARHRRAMKTASLLVLAFLVSYGFKVWLLGREDTSDWTLFDFGVLRVHELFVLSMVVAGLGAWLQTRRLRGTRLVSRDPADPVAEPRVVRRHRWAGRIAIASGLLGFLLAIALLAGMYARALP